MIRIFLFLVTLCSLLMSESIDSLEKLYDDGHYEEVIQKARLSHELYDDARLHLLWGKSAQKLGDQLSAMSAFERSVMLDSDNVELQVTLLEIYEALGRSMLAYELRESLARRQLTPEQRSRLAVIDERYESRLRMMARLGAGFDTNIAANSDFEDSTSENDQIIESHFAQLDLMLSYLYFMGEASQWYLRSDLQFYGKQYSESSYYDLYDAKAALGIGYQNGRVTLQLPVAYERLYYMDRDLLHAFKTYPSVTYLLNASWNLLLQGSYEQRTFIQETDSMQDDEIYGALLGVYYKQAEGFLYLKGGANRYEGTDENPLIFTDKDVLYAQIGGSYMLDAWQSRIDYLYRDLSYDEASLSNAESREETYHQVDFELGRVFNRAWYVGVNYRYSVNHSNYETVEYDKQIMMMQLRYSY